MLIMLHMQISKIGLLKSINCTSKSAENICEGLEKSFFTILIIKNVSLYLENQSKYSDMVFFKKKLYTGFCCQNDRLSCDF